MKSEKKLLPTDHDFALAAIAPIFIIMMIGSLTYFFILIASAGRPVGPMMWVLGLYTFAAVLIARIAIEQSRAYSAGYMVALGLATLAVLPRLYQAQGVSPSVSFPIQIFFLAMIAFLADRITFDCTQLDESYSSLGIGLLQSLGLYRSDPLAKKQQTRATPLAELTRGSPTPADEVQPASNSQKRSIHDKTAKERNHNQGVWVLYFALLAVPIFGIGQFFIANPRDRSFAFWLLLTYLFSSLSLLVLIALLSLRRYLRSRNIASDLGFITRWIAMGLSFALMLVAFLAVLPVPTETLWNWKSPIEIVRRPDLKAHELGRGNEGVNDPQVAPRAEHGDPPDQNAAAGKRQENERGNAPGRESDNPEATQGTQDGEDASGAASKENSENASPKNSGNDSKASSAPDNAEGNPPNDNQQQNNQQQNNQQQNNQQQNNQQPNERQPNNQNGKMPEWSSSLDLSSALRWILLVGLIGFIIYGLVKHRDSLMAFWRDLFPKAPKLDPKHSDAPNSIPNSELATFGSLRNPFASGVSNEQIVQQVFNALVVWGREKAIARGEQETPDEYVRRIAQQYPERRVPLTVLGSLYSRIAYARMRVGAEEVIPLQDLWRWLSASASTR